MNSRTKINLALSVDSNILRYFTPLLTQRKLDVSLLVLTQPLLRTSSWSGTKDGEQSVLSRVPLTLTPSLKHRFYCHDDGEPVGPGMPSLHCSIIFD